MVYDRTLRLMELAVNTPLELSPPYSYRAEYFAISTNTTDSTTDTQITASNRGLRMVLLEAQR